MTIAVGIVGCAGRMGKMLAKAVMDDNECCLSGGTENIDKFVGQDIGKLIGTEEIGCRVLDDTKELFNASDVVIDFTTPKSTILNISVAKETETPLIIGTTGLSSKDDEFIRESVDRTVIVKSSNFSIGINIIQSEIEKISGMLGSQYDAEILEMHHRNKIDAPSGTAIDFGKAIANGRKQDFSEVARFSREGEIGKRQYGEIGFSTLRGGEVIGDHSVIFTSPNETIKFTHNAHSRSIFSDGAILAAKWSINAKAGLYSMQDVLRIS